MTGIKKILKMAAGSVGMCLLLGVVGAQAAVLTVTTTADNGVGSLRQAIIDATANAAANTVTFDIPITDAGYDAAQNRFTISLLSQLPDVPLAPLILDNNQTQAVTVKGNNTFRILTLVNSAVLTINNLTISNGFSGFLDVRSFGGDPSFGFGGGIYMGNSSTLNLNRSTIGSNVASNGGGGIYINDSGTLNMNGSTVSGNAAANGGGIFNNTSGTINAVSSTIDGNSASGDGGGVYNTATITFTGNTISSNSANQGGGIFNNFTATLNNNLVALNTATDGGDLLGRGSLGNTFTGTYNLIGNADGSEGLDDSTNQSGSGKDFLDPLLGPLQNNGGATPTRALMYGSPAIDKGDSPGIIIDQRGKNRPYDNLLVANAGNGADIGAFEWQPAPTAATVSLGGRITAGKRGIQNIRVTLTDQNGGSRIVLSGQLGYYRLANVEAGQTYTISVWGKKYNFAQSVQVRSITEDADDINFQADN